MTFADTGALYAVLVSSDENHAQARSWLTANRGAERLVTTDYVLDELLTLLRLRGEFERSTAAAGAFFAGSLAEIHWVDRADVGRAAEVFDGFKDKQWSFTDCVSYAVIKRFEIKRAFAFDEHFRQFGTVEVLPGR